MSRYPLPHGPRAGAASSGVLASLFTVLLLALLVAYPLLLAAQPGPATDEQAVNQVLAAYRAAEQLGDSVAGQRLLAADAWRLDAQAQPYGRTDAHRWRRAAPAHGLTVRQRMVSLDSTDALVLETGSGWGPRHGLFGRRDPQTVVIIWGMRKEGGDWLIQSQTLSVRRADPTGVYQRREVRREANRFYWRQALLY
jgi:hypothetical protein